MKLSILFDKLFFYFLPKESPKEGDGEGETQEAAEGDATTEGDAPPSDEQGDDAKPEEDGEGEEKPEGDDNQEEETRSPIPQSDTFADGERPETPVVAVTEPLSREGSPTPAAEVELMQPGTPERMGNCGGQSLGPVLVYL